MFDKNLQEEIQALDEELSKRFISLDKYGYFLIEIDFTAKELIVKHFSNDIDEQGRAIDPDSGEPLPCNGLLQRSPLTIYRGHSAKEIGIKLTEGKGPHPISVLDHAMYLGRELQKAEICLLNERQYIQD